MLTHAEEDGIGAILNALASALKTMDDPGEAYNLAELVDTGLVGTKAEEIWRQMMAIDTSLYRSPSSQMLRAEGKVDALRRVLHSRGIVITQEQSDRLSACDDPKQADRWLDLALTATTAAEVFDTD